MPRNILFVLVWGGIALASMLASTAFGAASISVNDVVASLAQLFHLGGEEVSAIKQRIILELRAPRAVLAFLAGAGLSLAGAVLQTVFLLVRHLVRCW